MKFFDTTAWVWKIFTFVLLIVLTTSYSLVSVAAARPAGELIVSPTGSTEKIPVTVDGEAATSGRTLFSSSVVSTPEGLTATVDLGKAGRLQLGANTTFALSHEGDAAAGDLRAGTITALGSSEPIAIRTATGGVVKLNPGDAVDANSNIPARRGSHSMPSWGWAALIGTVAAIVIIAVVVSNNGNGASNNGSSVVVSPVH